MKKFLFILISAIVVLSIAHVNDTHASILLDFEMPRDNAPGDYPHSVPTPYGSVDFNGRIYNRISSKKVPDHTLGTNKGSFVKNTTANKVLTFVFSFDVLSIEAWTVVYTGASVTAKVYDASDTEMASMIINPNSSNWKTWEQNIDFKGTKDQPIRKLVLTGTKKNTFGVDDMKVSPVPEPASLALLGLGLLGAGLSRRKKKL